MRSGGDNLSVWEFCKVRSCISFELAHKNFLQAYRGCLCASNLLSLILFQYFNKSCKNITTFTVYM